MEEIHFHLHKTNLFFAIMSCGQVRNASKPRSASRLGLKIRVL